MSMGRPHSRWSGLGRSDSMRDPSPAARTTAWVGGCGFGMRGSSPGVGSLELAGQGSNLQPPDPKSGVLPVELPATVRAHRNPVTQPARSDAIRQAGSADRFVLVVGDGAGHALPEPEAPAEVHRGERRGHPAPRRRGRRPGRRSVTDASDSAARYGMASGERPPRLRTAAARRRARAAPPAPARRRCRAVAELGVHAHHLRLAPAVAAVLRKNARDRLAHSQAITSDGSNSSSGPACADPVVELEVLVGRDRLVPAADLLDRPRAGRRRTGRGRPSALGAVVVGRVADAEPRARAPRRRPGPASV